MLPLAEPSPPPAIRAPCTATIAAARAQAGETGHVVHICRAIDNFTNDAHQRLVSARAATPNATCMGQLQQRTMLSRMSSEMVHLSARAAVSSSSRADLHSHPKITEGVHMQYRVNVRCAAHGPACTTQSEVGCSTTHAKKPQYIICE